MKFSIWFILAAAPLSSVAGEGVATATESQAQPQPAVVATQIPEKRSGPAPWLGFEVVKPDQTTTAHLPSLPPGIGFVIRSVDAGGPAEMAGVQPLDVIWKFADQMLVNEGQLATLLNHHQPGKEVVLSLFRGGQPLDVTIALGEAPERRGRFPRDLVDAAMLPGEGGPMKVVNVGERTASFATDEGRAWIRREGDAYKIVLHGPDEKVIFQGSLTLDDDLDGVPKEWRRRVCALRRGLDHALEERMVPVRPPRPRVVPAGAPNR